MFTTIKNAIVNAAKATWAFLTSPKTWAAAAFALVTFVCATFTEIGSAEAEEVMEQIEESVPATESTNDMSTVEAPVVAEKHDLADDVNAQVEASDEAQA
ncbi:hypothetical protein [Vibrio phage vB_VmeM-Yong XC32]|nr:hypothetical protein [Vibrio phage vB_VmeM-Yong XC31]QAX96434.1 hypothetical protein [Vibrio phage vB_VmeM-Yong XC32]QAX96751.1 hypothetical protein [Vibrio phage vB_VmeM-Yong MS31]QAX97070.1 hypothetical protein [Vibrio phage vB_VmeM-Yong MS32]